MLVRMHACPAQAHLLSYVRHPPLHVLGPDVLGPPSCARIRPSSQVVTEEDLEEFARKKEEEKKAAQAGGALGGFAGGSAAAPAAKRAPAGSVPKAGAPGAKAGGGADHGHAAAAAAAAADEALAKMMAAVPLTEFEKSLHAFQRKRLEHERAKLQEEASVGKGVWRIPLCSKFGGVWVLGPLGERE